MTSGWVGGTDAMQDISWELRWWRRGESGKRTLCKIYLENRDDDVKVSRGNGRGARHILRIKMMTPRWVGGTDAVQDLSWELRWWRRGVLRWWRQGELREWKIEFDGANKGSKKVSKDWAGFSESLSLSISLYLSVRMSVFLSVRLSSQLRDSLPPAPSVSIKRGKWRKDLIFKTHRKGKWFHLNNIRTDFKRNFPAIGVLRRR